MTRLSAILFASLVISACANGDGDPYDPSMTGWQKDGGAGASTGGRGGSGATGGSGGSGATGGSGGSSATGGRGGSGATGGGGTGGSTGRGGNSGTGGSGGGGAAGRGGTGGGGTGGGGTGGSSVDAGACASTVDWMSGGSYSMGDKVRGVCSTASSGAGTTCTVGKTYTWTCSLAVACGFVGPGTANWGLAWAVGAECN